MSSKRFAVLVIFAVFYILSHTTAQNNLTTTTDRLALLAIKSMIKDDPQGVTTSWTDSNSSFCRWEGVTCSPRDQRVTSLDLSSRGLTGTLSPSIGNLTFLSDIWLFNNSLSGEIPPEIGRLFRLQQLLLNNNSFMGSIPPAISNCSNLQALDLGGNLLVGKIPDEIGSLSNLSFLALQTNTANISKGGIPTFIANLTSLDTLALGDCQFGGRIPDMFHKLTSLKRLALPGNNFFGSIPPSLYNLSSLEQVILDFNQLTGTLPANLGIIMPNLSVLSLTDNQFTGQLPASILSSPQLQAIDIARNNFSGKLIIDFQNSCNLIVLSLSSNSFGSGEDDEMKFIDELSKCDSLEALDLGYNQLKGFLPESLGELTTKLYFLSVASNHFSGGVPSSVGNLSGLTTLDFSSNQLTGTLPITIGNLENLHRLNVSYNLFSGKIPDSLGNLAQMLDMYLTSNQFNGTIPSSLGNCKRLIRLNLDRNQLTGEIPKQLFEISSLSIILNLGNNQLSGQLPTEVGNLINLNEINLSNNRLSGNIPSSLGSCIDLQKLNISNNLFSGSFPDSLGSLRGLENLDVSHNNFTGEIPAYLEVIPLTSLNLSYNELGGEVPIKGVFANASSVSIMGNSRVCGGVPELRLPECRFKKKKKLSLAVILIICFGSVLVFVTMVVVLFMCCARKTEIENDHPPETTSGEPLIQVSYETLNKATDGFSNKNFIGEGSFSLVYKGCLDTESANTVAIKVLNLNRRGGSKSFISECEALRNTRHRNLTKVVTCCSGVDVQGNEFKAIVYEFMPNGSLDKWLHNPQTELSQLSLVQRVCILLDVANALDYLHFHAGKTIVHCDLKPSNILLDDDMVAHVGDFGLSKILQSEYQYRYNSSSVGVRGTIGYTAPEYGVGSKVSRHGDMYSFGILLLEMMTRKKPTDVMFGEDLSLHSYAKKAMGDDGALEIVDPVLLKDDKKIGQTTNKEETTGYMNHERCLRLLLEIGVSCSMESPQYRMDTGSVIQELQLIKDAILGNYTGFLSSV